MTNHPLEWIIIENSLIAIMQAADHMRWNNMNDLIGTGYSNGLRNIAVDMWQWIEDVEEE